jgi:CubicO group peptidase (beta-lactamase class C family)
MDEERSFSADPGSNSDTTLCMTQDAAHNWAMDTQTAAAIVDSVFADTPEMALVPGVSYGLVHGGRLVHAGGRGCSTIGGGLPGERTIFRIASMTKSFTAATILMLRDEAACGWTTCLSITCR